MPKPLWLRWARPDEPSAHFQSIHKDLEKKIAHFHQREDAILYPSCFDANAGLFEVCVDVGGYK